MPTQFSERFRVRPGTAPRLADVDPGDTGLSRGKAHARAALAADLEVIHDLQYALHAEARRGLLICLQAPDAGGKDGTIRSLSAGLNPQGCHVVSFKPPTDLERAHDFLWRIHPHVPPHGAISIFNRSHYEDVLVTRVKGLVPEAVWRARYEHINAFERLLVDEGTRVIKFFLCISREEQLRRFAKRLDDPSRHWKIDEADYTERELWDDYVAAYEDVFRHCSPAHAPWFIIPANRKWYRNFVVARIVREALEAMEAKLPEPTVDLDDIRRRYLAAKNGAG